MPEPHADLSLLELDASEVAAHPDLLDRILRREIFGALIRNVFEPERLARAVERLERDPGMPVFESHTFRGRTYGRVLRMAGEDLAPYFEAAARVGPALEAAFGDEGPGYEATLRRILSAIGGGREVSVPVVEGRAYAPATVRVVAPGGTVDLHCGNETHKFPALRELVTVIDPAFEISSLLPLALPERGGELEVYALSHGDPRMRELDRAHGREGAHRAMQELLALRVTPRVGDLALFEEGRHFHRVSEVEGDRARWTMGGFLAPSRDGAILHYWS